MTKHQFIESPISTDKVIILLNTLGSSTREKVVTDLVQKGYLIKDLTVEQVTGLLNVQGKQKLTAGHRLEAIRALAVNDLMPMNLDIDQALDIVGNLVDHGRYGHQNHWYKRDMAIRALLGAKKPLIKTPISTEDLAKLIKGVTRKKELIAHLTKHQFIE